MQIDVDFSAPNMVSFRYKKNIIIVWVRKPVVACDCFAHKLPVW